MKSDYLIFNRLEKRFEDAMLQEGYAVRKYLRPDLNCIRRTREIMLGFHCIKKISPRTSIAIERFRAPEMAATAQTYSKTITRLWKEKRKTGCPQCGAVRKYSVGECSRCRRLRCAIRAIEKDVSCSLQTFIRNSYSRQGTEVAYRRIATS